MTTPGWYETFPENMTEEEYIALSEEISRTIEVVHGHVIKCESPTPGHNRIAKRLMAALEAARRPGGPCLTVDLDMDVILWRVPKFTFRRPDVVVYECLEDLSQKPTASRTLMVVEVSSPSTGLEDLVDKKVQYAMAGIPLYLVVLVNAKHEITEIREFHLDAAAEEYVLYRSHHEVLELARPLSVTVPFDDLLIG